MAMTSNVSHQGIPHHPLSTLNDSDEIRLLYLAPRSLNERITCVTLHVTLSSKPRYEALSYEWGSNETKTITLNGDDYDIRTNLFDALRRLRWEREERILWVDAICINQHDVRERNHQVSRMASIYSQARHVVVWLREPLDCGIALGFLESIAENELEETINHVFRTERSSKWGLQVLKGIQALSRKQYWTRLWVVQEALLASNTKIQCGPYCVPWGILKYVCQYLQSFISTYDTKETIYKTATAISESRMQIFMAGRPGKLTSNLSYLCWLHGKGECEKDLDKVFGLWALASDCCQEAIPVDYSSTYEEVLGKLLAHDVAAHGIPAENAGDLDAFKRQLFGRYGP
jgi:hypothetical protein